MTMPRDSVATRAWLPAPPQAGRRWLGAGLAACVIGWGTNQFTPMLLVYRARLGLSAPVVEAMFALYAIGLVPGLLAGGSLSDRVGRRPVVVFALITSVIGSGVLIAGTLGTGWLFAGRLIVGLGSGSAFSAGAAWIKELSAPPYDDPAPGAGARRASGSITLGFALGPLVAGALAQWAPLPTVMPYLPQLVAAGCALALVARTPETVLRNAAGADDARRWRPRVRGTGHPRFLRVVLPAAPWVFISCAVGFVYVPGLVAGHAFGFPVAFAAAAALAAAAGGVAVQPLAKRLAGRDRPHRPVLLVTGLSVVTAGLLAEAGITTAASMLGSWQPVLALLASAELGFGYGIILIFGLTEVARLARSQDLAGLTGVFQVACYTGFAAPNVLSLLQGTISAPVLLLWAAGLAAMTLVLTTWQAQRTAATISAGTPALAAPSD